MQLSYLLCALCLTTASAFQVRSLRNPDLPKLKTPKAPELKCGPVAPWNKHTPFEPNVNDFKSMCQACKIRACNAKLPMPGDGGKACRCQYSKVGDTYTTDCKPPFAKDIKSVGDWTNCPGGVRDCDALEGQCVSATFKMDSAPEMKVPKAPKMEEPKVPEVKKPKVPQAKCGPVAPWNKHTPFEPNVNDFKSMCQACKIRACNAKLPMPGDGGKACRCQYSKVGDTYTTDCKPPFAKDIKSVGDWTNCPGGVRDCDALEGQCVSATFKMDSAPEMKVPKAPKMEEPKMPEVKKPKVPGHQSNAFSKGMVSTALLAFFYLA